MIRIRNFKVLYVNNSKNKNVSSLYYVIKFLEFVVEIISIIIKTITVVNVNVFT